MSEGSESNGTCYSGATPSVVLRLRGEAATLDLAGNRTYACEAYRGGLVMRVMLFGIELNVALWLLVAGIVWAQADFEDGSAALRACSAVGLALSVVYQHWAYHRLKKQRQGSA